MAAAQWWIREVHNFGGFFGGDTVTLSAMPAPAGRPANEGETTLVIDEKAWSNVRDRYTIAPEMLVALELVGDRVERAELLAATDWSVLDAALDKQLPTGSLTAARLRAYQCGTCGLWVAGAPAAGACRICGTALPELLAALPSLEPR